MVTDNQDSSIEIELTQDDMYADGYIVDFGDGTQILQRDVPDYALKAGDDYVETVENQELTQVSYNEYTTSKLWWQIADANKIFNPFPIGPFGLTPGTGLNIPQQLNGLEV